MAHVSAAVARSPAEPPISSSLSTFARGGQASTSQRSVVGGPLRTHAVSNLRTGVFQRPPQQGSSSSDHLGSSSHTASNSRTHQPRLVRDSARLCGRRLGAAFSDATHDLYYSTAVPVLAGAKPKKLRKLAKRMRSRAAELQALSSRLAGEMQGGAGIAGLQQPPPSTGAAVAAADLLPQMQQLHAEFLALCEAAINEVDSSSSSSSSSDSDDCGKGRARATIVDHRQRQERMQQRVGSSATPQRSSSTAVLERPALGQQEAAVCAPATSGRVAVCMGGACRKRGAGALLLAFSEAAAAVGPTASSVEVAPCKCLGKCKMGPAIEMEVPGAEAPALHLGVDALAVPELWDTYFGVQTVDGNEAALFAGAQSMQPLLVSPPAKDSIIGLA